MQLWAWWWAYDLLLGRKRQEDKKSKVGLGWWLQLRVHTALTEDVHLVPSIQDGQLRSRDT